MAKFTIRNIYTETESELEGKKCILANTIGEIETAVNAGEYKLSVCHNIADGIRPFTDGKDTYMYCYYDPGMTPFVPTPESSADELLKAITPLTIDEQIVAIKHAYEKHQEPFDYWMLDTISKMEDDNLVHFLKDVFERHGYQGTRNVLKGLSLVRSDDEADLISAVEAMDGLKESIANNYMDNDMACNEKCERIKDWIQDVL